MTLSLKEFAKQRNAQTGPKCWLCGIPERAEVEEGFRTGEGLATICDWLRKAKGYGLEATVRKVSYHCQNHIRDEES